MFPSKDDLEAAHDCIFKSGASTSVFQRCPWLPDSKQQQQQQEEEEEEKEEEAAAAVAAAAQHRSANHRPAPIIAPSAKALGSGLVVVCRNYYKSSVLFFKTSRSSLECTSRKGAAAGDHWPWLARESSAQGSPAAMCFRDACFKLTCLPR
jgi:hypothetical protein